MDTEVQNGSKGKKRGIVGRIRAIRGVPILLSVLLIAGAFFLFGCSDDWEDWEDWEEDSSETVVVSSDDLILDEESGWVMYWYLCGSDLESDGGSASADFEELMSVDLPEDVTIVIQTGGAYSWESDYVDADKLQRFVYTSEGLELVYEADVANMGEAETLADFLIYASENYPSEHTIINLWNHGGGSVGGIAYDELYDYDSLELDELAEALSLAFEADEENPPIDIIGFDACLMATIDTANLLQGYGYYMVASEESEPSTGWSYDGFVQTMADYSNVSAYSLAVNICDTYVAGSSGWFGTSEDITLSVVNLTKIDEVVEAYEAVGEEALENAINDTSFFAQFAQVAESVENYGGNSKRLGYTNMADLGDLVEESSDLLPNSSDALLEALEDCVEYKVYGELCQESSGLSCYYSYSGDASDFYSYSEIAASESFTYFFNYSLTGELLDDGITFVEDLGVDVDEDTLPSLTTLNDTDWDGIALTVNDDACAVMDLGPEAYDILSTVQFELYYMDDSEEYLYSLGIDNDITGDWSEGIFIDNFRGVWGSIDGVLCYMELAYEGDTYNEYSVPIYLNGERYELKVIYDFDKEEWSIEGARKPISETGAVDKNLIQLESGDVIEAIYYVNEVDSDSYEFEEVIGEQLTVNDNTSFYEVDLDDGYYYWTFIMSDYQGNEAYSQIVVFEIEDGDIYTSLY